MLETLLVDRRGMTFKVHQLLDRFGQISEIVIVVLRVQLKGPHTDIVHKDIKMQGILCIC